MDLKQLFANIFDELYAPPGALEPMQQSNTTNLASEMSVEWHNNFGTAPDFSVPASSDMCTPFGGSDGSSFGCSWD